MPVSAENAAQALTLAYEAEVSSRCGVANIDSHTAMHIKKVADWLTAEKPKFGMLLCGQCGNGKTTLVNSLRSLIKYCYSRETYSAQKFVKMVDAKEIVRLAKTNDKEFKELCNTEMLAIDDLGIEPSEVLDYGNSINPAIDLLSYRYNEQLFTIITTNLTPSQIREHYGDRIADRFNEMMSKVIFDNPSYRTKWN